MNEFSTAGRYKARIIDSAVSQQDGSECVQFAAKVQVFAYFDEGSKTWQDCTDHDFGGFANVVVIKKDGNPNESGIGQLERALGWDGKDFAFLTQQFAGHEVQVTVGSDTYNGVTKLKVKWLDNVDAEGGALKSLDQTGIQALNAKFGAKLRAIAKPSAPATGAGAPKMMPAKKQY